MLTLNLRLHCCCLESKQLGAANMNECVQGRLLEMVSGARLPTCIGRDLLRWEITTPDTDTLRPKGLGCSRCAEGYPFGGPVLCGSWFLPVGPGLGEFVGVEFAVGAVWSVHVAVEQQCRPLSSFSCRYWPCWVRLLLNSELDGFSVDQRIKSVHFNWTSRLSDQPSLQMSLDRSSNTPPHLSWRHAVQ